MSPKNENPSPKDVYIVVGRSNTGKTTLTRRLAGFKGITEEKFQETHVFLEHGKFEGTDASLINTPGNNFTFTDNEDELIIRKLFLQNNVKGILFVADAKSLAKSLALFFYYQEFGVPILLNLNMTDEASIRGLVIDTYRLAKLLGVTVNSTVAIESSGISPIKNITKSELPIGKPIRYTESIETYLNEFEKLTLSRLKYRRLLALAALTGDSAASEYIVQECGETVGQSVHQLVAKTRQILGAKNIPNLLTNIYHSEAEQIARQVVTLSTDIKIPFMDRLGVYSTRLATGIPIALLVFTGLYFFVGRFGAQFLVDLLEKKLFGQIINPYMTVVFSHIPSPFVQEMFMGKYGILSTGITLAFGIVFPVLLTFYFALGVLESSGYLARLTILFERFFKKLGMTGKGIIPLLLGFSCITMAIITTRILDGRKEKIIASVLLVLGIPCAPLLGVALVLLSKMTGLAYVLFFGIIFLQVCLAGLALNQLIKSPASVFLFEVPSMRLPHLRSLISGATRRTYGFLVEAVPIFILSMFSIFIIDKLGGIVLLGRILKPLLVGFIGLPVESVTVFLMSMIRRESGIAMLSQYADLQLFTHVQILINLILLSFCVPCINAMITLIKERGLKLALCVLAFTIPYAVLLGGFLNWVLTKLNVTL
ncbi:MAG: ferrous iron transporter B [Deltaproteobacteria bacterium]|nr:ferrous iron transporter B [Deltaproteobacteria bacterium]